LTSSRDRTGRAFRVLLIVGFVLGLAVIVAWPWFEAVRLVVMLAGTGPLDIARLPIVYETDGRRHSGDRYPAQGPQGSGLVLVPGAAAQGKDDPRLIRVAALLARAGFTVLVPDIASQKALRVGPENIDDVADAVLALAKSQRRVGVAAISYAVGPAVLAARRLDGKLAFLVGVGGYYDLSAVIGFFTTGWYFEDGRWQERTPNAYGKWVFVESNAARLWDSGDRALLGLMAARRRADPTASLDDLAPRLTSSGRAIYDLLANGDPARVPDLISRLPAMIGDDIRALDLKTKDLSGLTAHLLLIHGRGDAIIPAGESRKLAAAVPMADLFLVDDLAHADWTARSVAGVVSMVRAVRALLDERDLGR
jgi:pimeloyl-ACP methyl ester carboxylesterase